MVKTSSNPFKTRVRRKSVTEIKPGITVSELNFDGKGLSCKHIDHRKAARDDQAIALKQILPEGIDFSVNARIKQIMDFAADTLGAAGLPRTPTPKAGYNYYWDRAGNWKELQEVEQLSNGGWEWCGDVSSYLERRFGLEHFDELLTCSRIIDAGEIILDNKTPRELLIISVKRFYEGFELLGRFAQWRAAHPKEPPGRKPKEWVEALASACVAKWPNQSAAKLFARIENRFEQQSEGINNIFVGSERWEVYREGDGPGGKVHAVPADDSDIELVGENPLELPYGTWAGYINRAKRKRASQ